MGVKAPRIQPPAPSRDMALQLQAQMAQYNCNLASLANQNRAFGQYSNNIASQLSSSTKMTQIPYRDGPIGQSAQQVMDAAMRPIPAKSRNSVIRRMGFGGKRGRA